jgi:serine/threonine-protein kinase HipA
MGVFEDSLPDGWGRLLLDRRMIRAGISPGELSPLDRLAWVGSSGMGALVYEPEQVFDTPTVIDLAKVAREVTAALNNSSKADLDRLFALGGSPHKVPVQKF